MPRQGIATNSPDSYEWRIMLMIRKTVDCSVFSHDRQDDLTVIDPFG